MQFFNESFGIYKIVRQSLCWLLLGPESSRLRVMVGHVCLAGQWRILPSNKLPKATDRARSEDIGYQHSCL